MPSLHYLENFTDLFLQVIQIPKPQDWSPSNSTNDATLPWCTAIEIFQPSTFKLF